MALLETLQGAASDVFISSLRLILLSLLTNQPHQFQDPPNLLLKYDFVVVGAGAGGCVVANRLSETGATVLLLEAGPSEAPESALPGLTPFLYGGDRDWKVKGKPQRNTQQGFFGNSSYTIAGKSMGGGTSINGLVYARGNKRDYDNWASLGNTGWDYKSVLPYFKKSEDFQGRRTSYTDEFHGSGGPLTVEEKSLNTKILKSFAMGSKELGYSVIDDSGPRQIGFSPIHATTKDGIRASASESFIRPVIGRTNLHVLTDATVNKVIFNEKKQATGVEYTHRNERRSVSVSKEVVISAGALFTPKLLMLSGVGPAKTLNKFNIPVVAAVEGVGQNLNDHPNVYLAWRVKPGSSTPPMEPFKLEHILQYLHNKTGYYGTVPAIEMNAWLHLSEDGDQDWPEVQLFTQSMSFAFDGGKSMARALGLRREVFDDIYGPLVGQEAVQIGLMLSRPKSKGTVTIDSYDPNHPPLVDTNYFDHPDDIKLMVKGIRKVFNIVNTKAVQDGLQATYLPSTLRYCSDHGAGTDQYWECYARYTILTNWHYSGTAKMAPRTDPMSVVTPRLRLRGVAGVRVVDASVMPEVISANTMAVTYMIGEKGADLIKEDWGYSTAPLPA